MQHAWGVLYLDSRLEAGSSCATECTMMERFRGLPTPLCKDALITVHFCSNSYSLPIETSRDLIILLLALMVSSQASAYGFLGFRGVLSLAANIQLSSALRREASELWCYLCFPFECFTLFIISSVCNPR